MSPLTTLALVLVGGASLTRAALVEHYWNISYAIANPNGLGERRVIGVNGTWPPPPVIVTQNDTLRIHIINGLGEASSYFADNATAAALASGPAIGTGLHSHGNFFNGSSYYDGAIGITQCPVPPGMSMTYDIPTSAQTGTYWIHGHYMGQYTDGLRTPFIIQPLEPRSDNLTWDDEYTVIVSDWYQRSWKDLLDNEFLTWTNPTGAEPVPTSAVIYVVNSSGEFVATRQGVADGSGTNDAAIIPFKAGKRYRLRFINMSTLSMFHIAIDDHVMQVIEVDGTEVAPFTMEQLLGISVAQRYSVYVEAKNASDANYGMQLYQDPVMYDVVPDDLVLNNTLTIQYDSSLPSASPVNITDDEFPMTMDTDFAPLLTKAMAPADVSIPLVITFDTYDDGNPRAAFNDITYQRPITPSLFSALSMGSEANQTSIYGAMTNAVVLEHNKNYELMLINTDSGNHPFHLHGHEFQIVGRSMDYTLTDTVQEDQPNPSRRDTVMVPGGGWTAVRFRADNPGAWIFHCHIEWHMDQGLAMVFIAAPDVLQQTQQVPSYMLDQCSAQGISPTGNIVGLNSTTNLKGEPYGPWPQVLGWTTKAKGAMAGCVLTALAGLVAVVWYGWGELDEDEVEEEVRRKMELKQTKKEKGGLFKRAVGK